jgi:hypothetical protein
MNMHACVIPETRFNLIAFRKKNFILDTYKQTTTLPLPLPVFKIYI